jgi:hypothetical protein
MNVSYWWVNHKQTYHEENAGNYIWSPKTNKNGARNETYLNLTRVKVGDIIFSYANGKISDIGVVSSPCIECDKPTSFGKVGDQWDKDGWKVAATWSRLSFPIHPKEHIPAIGPLLPEKNSPHLKTGGGFQGCYLAAISNELGELLLARITDAGNAGIKHVINDARDSIADDQVEVAVRNDKTLPETDREAIIKARIGQGLFRSNLKQVESGCRVTGITDERFLIASHIKPWRNSNNDERIDGNNGLLLSPHIDRLFDKGWISFSDSGDMLISDSAPDEVLQKWGIKESATKKAFSEKQKAYLAYHRNEIFLDKV